MDRIVSVFSRVWTDSEILVGNHGFTTNRSNEKIIGCVYLSTIQITARPVRMVDRHILVLTTSDNDVTTFK